LLGVELLHALGHVDDQLGQHDDAVPVGVRSTSEALDPRNALAHNNLDVALMDKGQLEEAIRAYRTALDLDPKLARAHYNLGLIFQSKNQLEEAIREYRLAIDLNPDYALAHNNLGNALRAKGQLDEAIQAYRAALASDPKYGTARTNLRQAGRLAQVEPRLTPILEGKAQSADAAESLALAQLCQEPFKRLLVAASRFYAAAFAGDAKLADDLQQQYRYNAACAAALAGCGQGKDVGQLDDAERARLRRQALEWLQADLALWGKQAESHDAKARAAVRQHLHHWQGDPDLAGLRDPAALAKLPEAERAACQQLWADVVDLLRRAAGGK
jgi:Tfp pilus assembly protein PilF